MIQRYSIGQRYSIPDDNGKYIKYEDHIETVRELEKEMSEIKEQLEKLRGFAKDLYFLGMKDIAFNPHWRAEKHGVLELLTKDGKTT